MKKLIAVALMMAFAPMAMADYTDNFESYADATAMNAVGAWGDDGITSPATLETDTVGSYGQYMFHPGGTTSIHVMDPMVATATQAIVWEFDMLDDGAGNKRVCGGLRDNGGGSFLNGILEHGTYNQWSGSSYGVRAVWIYGGPSWVEYPGLSAEAGWHHFKAVLTDTTATFTIDLQSDGTIDGELFFEDLTGASALNWNAARFGGPSNASSAGGGVGFDNLSLTTVAIPEPASLALLAFGGLALIRRR